MTETAAARLGRLRMRSMRRGIREMDLILIAFSDRALTAMDEADLALYERLLAENDHDLLAWITGTAPVPPAYAAMIATIRDGATGLGGD